MATLAKMRGNLARGTRANRSRTKTPIPPARGRLSDRLRTPLLYPLSYGGLRAGG
jgi:hypothetical protein